MFCRFLSLILFFILVSSVNAREYLVNQVLPIDSEPEQVTLNLFATAEGSNPLEMHVLPENQWQLQDVSGEVLVLHAYIDTHLPQPLWAEVTLDGQTLVQRSELRSIGGVTTEGEIHSKTGYRFPDDSVQTSAVDTQALDMVMGGSSSCPAGSSIRAIDASGNVTCETDNVGTGTVTRVDTGAGLTGGPVTAIGTVSVASNGIVSSMIQDGTVGSADINANQVQRRVSGVCEIGQTVIAINVDGSLDCGPGVTDYSNQTHYQFILDSEGTVGIDNDIAVGFYGLPVISYLDLTNKDLKVARCNDATCSSATVNTLDSAGDVGYSSSIAIGVDGLPVISYYDTTLDDLKIAKCNNTVCSSATIGTIDSTGDVGQHTSITVGTDGLPVISYQDYTNTALKIGRCSNATCSSADVSTLDNTGDVGYFTSIAIGTDGLFVISHYDRTNENLKVAKCNNADCSSISHNILDSAGDVGWHTSITIGADGLPVISYLDDTNMDLKVAKCTDGDCSDANLYTLDTGVGTLLSSTSIAIGTDDLPMISYYDSPNTALKVAKCNNEACSDTSLSTVDSTGSVGRGSSITIGADGLPIISYFDDTNNGLKVTKCGNLACD